MKPFQTVVLAVFGLGALIGIVVFATSQGIGGGSQAIGPVTIWGLLPQDSVDAALSEISVTDKRFAEVIYAEIPAGTFGTDLASAIAEGAGPDLVIISQEQLIAERGKLSVIPFTQIPERTYVDSYVPISELFLTADGTYGIPLLVDPLVLYYNRAELDDAGVASPPTTWEAINGLADSLTESSPAGVVSKSVIPLGDYANIANARAILSTIFFQAGIPISAQGEGIIESALVENGGNIVSAQAALDFYTQFADPAKTVYTWNRALPYSRDAFLAGNLIFYPGFASERSFLVGAGPNLNFDMAALPQPATASTRTTYGLVYVAAIPRASLNPVGATEVAFALASPSSAQMLAQAAAMAPALRSLLLPSESDRFAGIFYPEALRARGWLSPSTSITDGIFAGMIGNVTSGRRSVLEALQSADDSLDAALP